MARNEGLEDIMRDELRDLNDLVEKAMFGGLAWMLNGNLLCCVRNDSIMMRLGQAQAEAAINTDGITPMMSGTRLMKGWINCSPELFIDGMARTRLLTQAIDFVRTLPKK